MCSKLPPPVRLTTKIRRFRLDGSRLVTFMFPDGRSGSLTFRDDPSGPTVYLHELDAGIRVAVTPHPYERVTTGTDPATRTYYIGRTLNARGLAALQQTARKAASHARVE